MQNLTLFETLRTTNQGTQYLWFNDHLGRLRKALKDIKNWSKIRNLQLREVERQLQSILPFEQEKRIKISVFQDQFSLEIEPLLPFDFSHGVEVRDVIFQRSHPQWKYQSDVYKKYAPKGSELWFETLFLDKKGQVLEGNITNVFCLIHEVLITPPKNLCLDGIARQKVLQKAKKLGIKIEERAITKEEIIKHASSMFLTNSVRGIIPVKKWEERSFQSLAFHEFLDL